VALVPYQGPVQQLAPAAADPPFHDRVHSRRLNGGADDPGVSGLEDRVERGGEGCGCRNATWVDVLRNVVRSVKRSASVGLVLARPEVG
jgi:hypothetical protein